MIQLVHLLPTLSVTLLSLSQPSALSITINGGVNQTRVNNVNISLSATGATEMCFSNDGNAWSTGNPIITS